MKRIRTVAVLPTLVTLGNLVCGFFAIVVASRIEAPRSAAIPTATEIQFNTNPPRIVRQLDREDPTHNLMLCGWLIFLAMLCDGVDGRVARLAKASSDFGAQLDSLGDLVAFGVAPAFLLVKMCPSFSFLHPKQIWIIAALFAVCAALRLARFNVETDEEDDHMYFSGLPTPAAAAGIAAFAILSYTLRKETNLLPYGETIDLWMQNVLPLFAVLVALLMVSRIPYPHVVNQVLRGQRSFGHVVRLIFALVAVMVIRGYAVPLICGVFIFGPPVRYGWRLARDGQAAREPFF
ncbi:MAG: CDP-diacylglycerol--serine O-phosphatidyltransferase [Planctomycetes bacterium RBG_16_64_10]|nr:MAG: CDP-diacylglycerol--serine O-phosphatidyltransferase [Planctomycetes bacterium RBG_16_64_10]